MSTLPIETAEPDPTAISLPSDDAVKNEGGDSSTSTVKDAVIDVSNGSAEVKPEENGTSADLKEEKPEQNGASVDTKKSAPRERTYEDGVLKTSAQEIEGVNNSRYDPSILSVTDDPKLIRAQVEFYFGDSNLPSDNHMWGLTKGIENLPVSIKHELCKFGRMKRFQPYAAIVSALKESKFLEVSGPEGEEKVKRKTAYDPTIPKSKSEARSIYVKGFGDEDPSSQFDIEAFFAPYGPTNSVRLRRTDDKLFKGSVFVEFQDEDIAKKFLELDPKPLWKGKHILKVMSKTAYVEMKNEEIREGKTEAKPHRDNDFKGRGRGRGRGRGEHRGGRGRNDRDRGDLGDRSDRGDRDPDDWKKRREEDRASGFKDSRRGDRNSDRNDRRGNNRDRGGRGGRGRRDDRGPRNNDRNREREDKNKESKTDDKGVKSEKEAEVKNEKKRPHEDDDGEQAPAKKVDIKSEVAAEAS